MKGADGADYVHVSEEGKAGVEGAGEEARPDAVGAGAVDLAHDFGAAEEPVPEVVEKLWITPGDFTRRGRRAEKGDAGEGYSEIIHRIIHRPQIEKRDARRYLRSY
jgi:hypothetical protein